MAASATDFTFDNDSSWHHGSDTRLKIHEIDFPGIVQNSKTDCSCKIFRNLFFDEK